MLPTVVEALLRPAKLSPVLRTMSWIAQILAAVIMGQTLFFKFAAAPEPVHIFTTLGVEPWGRLATAVFELIAVVLLMIPRAAVFGGLLGVGLMIGAIGSHLTRIGIVVLNDGGLLFGMALATLIASVTIVLIRRKQLTNAISTLRSASAIRS